MIRHSIIIIFNNYENLIYFGTFLDRGSSCGLPFLGIGGIGAIAFSHILVALKFVNVIFKY